MRKLIQNEELFKEDAKRLSLKEMSVKYGMKECTVSKWKKMLDVLTVPKNLELPDKDVFSKDIEKYSNVELAEKYGVGLRLISKWRLKLGLANVYRSQTWDVEQFKRDAVSMRGSEVCAKYSICMSDLGYWKKKYSLTTGKKEKRKVVFMVINNPGCWICTSHKPNDKGYPQCKGERIVAIRMWEDKNKKSWPNGLVCIHSCDNAACINPDHVYPSTMKDNQSGMADRHRSPWGWRCGARKLTPEQAKEIYDLKGIESSSSIGKRYGVDHVTVLNIWKGTTWWRDVAGMGNFDVKLSSVKGMSGLLQRSEDESGVEYDGCVD